MYYTWSIVGNYMISAGDGLMGAVCDYKGMLWYDKGFSYWVLTFYISKFYEFFDTWITMLNGREPTLLQGTKYNNYLIIIIIIIIIIINNHIYN